MGPSDERVTLTKVAGGWGFMVAAVAFYDGTAALMKDVYGKQILPVFPLKPVNKVSLVKVKVKGFAFCSAPSSHTLSPMNQRRCMIACCLPPCIHLNVTIIWLLHLGLE